MSAQSKKMVAVFGAALMEEKEFCFVSALAEECRRRDTLLLVFSFAGDNMEDVKKAARELAMIRLVRRMPLVAIVCVTETIKQSLLTDELIRLGQEKEIPVFSYENFLKGCINIRMQHKEGFRDMVRHIVEDHGCTKVNMIAGFKGNPFSDERIDAYKEVLADNGIPFEESRLGYGEFWDRPTRLVLRRFLESGDLPQAIVCANDFMAITTCVVLREAGIRVPEDVIVGGFDGTMSGLINVPPVATVTPDYDQCAAFIMNTASRPPRQGVWREEIHEMDFLLKPRHSCGCREVAERAADEKISEISESFMDTNWSIKWLNQLTIRATSLDSLAVLAQEALASLDLWLNPYHFVAVYPELLADEPGRPSGRQYTTYFRHDSRGKCSLGETYEEEELLPDLDWILSKDSGVNLLVFRMLSTAEKSFGYIAEGFDTANNRDFRRCEELGMFLSTSVNIVLNNRKLGLLYRNLLRANKEIEQSAVRDYLTGIYNRRGFNAQLEVEATQESNFGRYLTLFSVDMDGLKVINDRYGHKEGDFAIRMMAGALSHFVARNGFCARYGGDEFACALVTDTPVDLPSDMVRDRIRVALQAQPEVAEKAYEISASIGSSCARIREELDIEEMIKAADIAMYQDKQERRIRRG